LKASPTPPKLAKPSTSLTAFSIFSPPSIC
jgi:hypothetical protein